MKNGRTWLLASCTAGIIFAVGCAKKVTKVDVTPPPPADTVQTAPVVQERASFDTVSAQAAVREALMPIYFEFNEYSLKTEGLERMQIVGKLLNEQKNVAVVMEGNCDERGSSEYNIGLGERRALAVKKWLTAYGISDSRLETSSYGRERPAVSGCTDDACHAKNRRVEFKVLVR